jgi:chitin synthase
MPSRTSVYHLWKAFDIISKIGGEIIPLKGTYGPYLINDLHGISNILDKLLKSMFGYITVLPGAFSA